MKVFLTNYSVAFLSCVYLAFSATPTQGATTAPDPAAIAAVAQKFHEALAAGEPDLVMSLLLPDALVIEGGVVQTRSEYEREHLGADIAYARAVPGKRLKVIFRQEDGVAWVTSTFHVAGKFEGRPVNSFTAETMIMTRTSAGWRIQSVHWSSHKASTN